MKPVLLLRELGFSELACQFAAFVGRQQQNEDALVTLAAGLVSEAVSEGHVCLNLREVNSTHSGVDEHLPDLSRWLSSLQSSEVVGMPGEFKPLILTSQGLLYLYRFWQSEQQVASALVQRLNNMIGTQDYPSLTEFIKHWHNPLASIDWQKVAVLSALKRQLSVISGGPGTGKTTVVIKILQCMRIIENVPRIALAAPTGKAAARLQQAISQRDDHGYEVQTLHRLLGISARFDQGRYSADKPLPLDMLIVDEASMIDINLMAITLKALPLNARLILLGDSDQLASVESGALLANLCARPPRFSSDFQTWVEKISDIDLSDFIGNNPLQDSLVVLEHSYRFAAGGLIGQLASAVKTEQVDLVISLLASDDTDSLLTPNREQIETVLLQGYHDFIVAVEQHQSAEICMQRFEQFRMLCALKSGPHSVSAVNQHMHRLLAKRGWKTAQPFYAGRPVMITQNHYRLNLFNGDIGLILPDAEGELTACFQFNHQIQRLPLSRLPGHETVFAMTVHKSQGSEFDQIALLLPEETSPVLTKELVYTALTRARSNIKILSTQHILKQTIQRRHQRESGLERLMSDLTADQ